MFSHKILLSFSSLLVIAFFSYATQSQSASAAGNLGKYTFVAGHSSLQEWILPALPPYPENNQLSQDRILLGEKLFFDNRLSGDGTISCKTCHDMTKGWSDGRVLGIGIRGTELGRNTPTIVNSAYNSVQMWDGRFSTLEEQVLGPLLAASEMDGNLNKLIAWLNSDKEYRQYFSKAFPGEKISTKNITLAIAAFERTVVSRNSNFDKWVQGNRLALSPLELAGFRVFVDPEGGNCAVCHASPNFTDNGFHNIGVKSLVNGSPDHGRFSIKPVRLMKGAFKTPTLRDISLTAPYFHDGSAETLSDVIQHYEDADNSQGALSPEMKNISISQEEKMALIAFLQTLTSDQ